MSELIQKNDNRATIRWKLLTGASALALTAYVSSASIARADDADHPVLWVELGGQLNLLNNGDENFKPSFFDLISSAGITSPAKIEKPEKYGLDEYGKLSFQPDGSNWVFSAAIRYGRSTNKNRVQQAIAPEPVIITYTYTYYYQSYPPHAYVPIFGKFADTNWATSERHAILDFQAGKDVGLGLFGSGSSSVVSFGVRFAQFSSKSTASINADPTIHNPTHQLSFYSAALKYKVHGDVFWENDHNSRSFHGIGPSLTWQGSAPIAGHSESSELAIDWGLNAALLFGRQRAQGYHQSSSLHFSRHLNVGQAAEAVPTHIGPYVTHNRSGSVTVPNIGGSIGFSFKSGDAKVSFGYRADLFMNAMDTGIDTRKTSNLTFNGPYASISIGIGD